MFDALLLAESSVRSRSPTSSIRTPSMAAVLQDTRRANLHQRVRLSGELQRLTNRRGSEGDEAAIRERLGALQELESGKAAELRRAYNQIDDVLDVRQQARLRVLEEQLERRKLELLMRARQNRVQQRRHSQVAVGPAT
jgi:hypothetical protein